VAIKDRFERLEPERAGEAAAARSGGQPERFRGPEPEPALRVMDLDEGQSFVRCARCQHDHHAATVRCTNCGADLATRAQRDFNQALWQRRREESAEEEAAVEKLRAARAQADRSDAEALRLRAALERDVASHHRPLESWEDAQSRWVVQAATRAGRVIGGWLRRVLSGDRR
jgi:ribosomal protein L37E